MVVTAPNPFALAGDIINPPEWEAESRFPLQPHQLPPGGFPKLWMLEGGRGAGKTEACARYFARYMRMHPGHRGRIIAPTFGDAVEACVLGPSGILSMDPEVKWLPSAPGGAKLIWPTGGEALVLGTPFPKDVDRLRAGGNRHIDWWEEAAANAQLRKAWEQAEFGLRLGPHPHSIASTTPRTTPDYSGHGTRDDWPGLRNIDGVVLSHASMFDNPGLGKEWMDGMRKRYQGTRMGRQELDGMLIGEVVGALWTHETIDMLRRSEVDMREIVRIVVGVDPAVTSGPEADDTGIVVVGLHRNGRGYVLDDKTCHLSPDGWARQVAETYHHWRADRIIVEVNQGGELVKTVMRTVDKSLPIKDVHAARGKQTRAEPVAALYEQEKVHHLGGFAALEDEMCTWVPGNDSPDRMDALVWALTELMVEGGATGAPKFAGTPKGSRHRI